MDQTIAAVATAPGEGGIGIIRISGDDSLKILIDVFRYRSGRRIGEDGVGMPGDRESGDQKSCDRVTGAGEAGIRAGVGFPERRMVYGDVVGDDGGVIDECMVVYMKAPRSYTGEDVVEIQCHGSVISLRRILELVISKGAALAERGEFTKRAFLNGRLDLSQAEAVIDLIGAKSDMGYDAAVSQLSGSLSGRIRSIRKDMADLIADIVAHIEYPEEDLEELTYEKIIGGIDRISADVRTLADSADTGRAIRDGLKVAIIGRPNVGKSSLMNAILRTERAIVTDIPGTTRDTIEELATIGGIPVRLTDTAGIRDTEDTIEKIGIEKSRHSMNEADIVVLILDGSADLADEDIRLLGLIEGRRSIVIVNKTDKGVRISKETLAPYKVTDFISMSTVTGQGIKEFTETVKAMVFNGQVRPEADMLITNVRHETLLREALQLMGDAREMLVNGEALDFAESDLRSAWMSLGEITGEAVTDDIVNEVFSRFCLGK